MAAVTASYNGVALPVLGKVSITGDERVITYSFDTWGSNITASFAALREWDKGFSLVSEGNSAAYALSSNAVSLRPSISKLGSPMDAANVKRYRFSVQVNLRNTIEGIDGVREWNVSESTDEQGRVSLTIRAEVTAQDANTAVTNLDAAAPAIEALAYAALGVSSLTFEEPRTEILNLDRYNEIATLSRARTMLLFPNNELNDAGTSEQRDDTLIFPIWSITRVRGAEVGRPDMDVRFYDVSWQCRLAYDKPIDPNPPTTDGFITEQEENIRGIIIKRLKTIFGEGLSGAQTGQEPLVIETDSITFDQTGMTASSVWRVRVNSGLLEYVETIGIDYQYANHDKITDGNAFTMARKTVGTVAFVSQQVNAKRSDLQGVQVLPPTISIAGTSSLALDIISSSARVTPMYNPYRSGVGSSRTSEGQTCRTAFSARYALVDKNAPGTKYQNVEVRNRSLLGGGGLESSGGANGGGGGPVSGSTQQGPSA